MSKLIIYELDMTGGTCGFPAEIPGQAPADRIRHELIRRSKISKEIKMKMDIEVERILLKSVSFLDDEIVKNFLKKEGINAFPIFMIENRIIHWGSFPDFEVLQEKICNAK